MAKMYGRHMATHVCFCCNDPGKGKKAVRTIEREELDKMIEEYYDERIDVQRNDQRL